MTNIDTNNIKFNNHTPVMMKEILQFLEPKNGKVFIDCTFGAGGHSYELLKNSATVIAIDRDINNKKFADEMQKEFKNNLIFINDKFSNIKNILLKLNIKKIDGILYDIGVSSMQIDEESRGFSFLKNGNLSMEMGLNNLSAYDVVNKYNEKQLADIIYNYGNEKFSRKIAKKIVENRLKKPIQTTLELSNIIHSAVNFYNDKINPSTRTFQAIRIEVNQELYELEKSLIDAVEILPFDCKICVLSFHSLEDVIVKNIFKKYSQQTNEFINRNDPLIFNKTQNSLHITLEVITKKPIIPTNEEIKLNPRSRSAKLRVSKKI